MKENISNLNEEKKAYLRQQILEKGYDKDDFLLFLMTKKGQEGLDIDNWEVCELMSIVSEYIKKKKNKIKQS